MTHPAIELRKDNPTMSAAEIARALNISRQRVSRLLRKYRLNKTCDNCYHSNNSFCTCREVSDMVHSPNKCPDWYPKEK